MAAAAAAAEVVDVLDGPDLKRPKLDGDENCRPEGEDEKAKNEKVNEKAKNEKAKNEKVNEKAKNEKVNEKAKNLEEEKVDNEVDDGCGEILWCGTTQWHLLNDSKLRHRLLNLYVPHRMPSMSGIRIRRVCSGPAAGHCALITDSGSVYTFGRNHLGQLGLGDKKTGVKPRLVEALTNILIEDAACGRSHTLFLTARGEVFSCGDNKFGQCGVGIVSSAREPSITLPRVVSHSGRRLVKVSAGGDFSLVLDCAGQMLSFGHPENGQLGHGVNNQHFEGTKLSHKFESRPVPIEAFVKEDDVRAGRPGSKTVIDGVRVARIVCGVAHSACVDTEGRLWTWGFGGYGRLGHNSTKDEMRPRLVNYFNTTRQRIDKLACGSTYTIATVAGQSSTTYFWGQQKSSGEANMYPKVFMDLTGWEVRQLSAGYKSCCALADNSCITWGPSPTYGELGHGEMVKSSTRPIVCKALEKVQIGQVAMGYAQCVYLVPCRAGADAEAKLGKFPSCRE